MEAARQSPERDGQERPLIILDRVLAKLDHLDVVEQAAVQQALQGVQRSLPGATADSRLRRVPGDESIYTLLAAPEVLLFVRLAPDGPVELVELVRPETLRQFSVAAATPKRA